MNGLLDYLKQGQTALTNATGMDWNKIQADPGANAQALMGGQAMQYNQQPQSLIAEKPQVDIGHHKLRKLHLSQHKRNNSKLNK